MRCVISQNSADVTCTVTLPSKNMIVNINRKAQHNLLSKSSKWVADNSRITNVKSCITLVNEEKCLFVMYFWTLNSNMFPEFLYRPHLSLHVKGLQSSAPGH